jgi:hypothetical protein
VVRKYADNRQSDSLAAQLRRKRFELFTSLLDSLPGPVRVLDVGGTEQFWGVMGFPDSEKVQVTLLNLAAEPVSRPGFSSVAGDATHMAQYRDGGFDVVFSNSVIEHVGDFSQQRRMAEEVRRVGRRYFVQTPNRYFPIEPHFLFPFFQFLPADLKAFLAYRYHLGWYGQGTDRAAIEEAARTIRLLTRRELRQIFPEAAIYRERFLALTKSFMVCRGWERVP